MDNFYDDVIKGLTSNPKYLFSKYFYDAEGDAIFQRIMHSPDYYLTDCELEIFQTKCKEFADLFKKFEGGIDLIELGAGDAYKSTELLKCLLAENIDFTYYPTDISENVVKLVETNLPKKLPNLKIRGVTGEFFDTLSQITQISAKPKVVLFLGSNIGNMPPEEASVFLKNLREHLSKGDLTIIGFDLKKNPWVIFRAYNDRDKITKEFNLNLLRRINKELNADFDLDTFDHYESYDPETGACKSYLFSLVKQQVQIGDFTVKFRENEHIFMETSQKYTLDEIEDFARTGGFKSLTYLFDSKKRFTDAIWECK